MAELPSTVPERVARLEAEIRRVEDVAIEALRRHAEIVELHNETIDKLDDLLALRNKGVGAFWLASILTGSGIIGILTWAMSIFKVH